jgi:hypothetical protein
MSLLSTGTRCKRTKTYNSGDSLVVTHLTTNPPVHCLYMAERTGSLIFSVLWSYVQGIERFDLITCMIHITVAGSDKHQGVCRYCDVGTLAQGIVCVEVSFMHTVREIPVVAQY